MCGPVMGSAAREYFTSIAHGTTEPQRQAYADDAVINIYGAIENAGKAELIAYFEQVWDAIPDFVFEVVELIEDRDTTACHWRATGTFAGPGSYDGIAPNGARLEIRGVDVVQTGPDGRIVRNDAYLDGLGMARQLGVLPPKDSPLEQRLTKVTNFRGKVTRHFAGPGVPEPIADGIWRVQGHDPARCTVYLVRDGDGVLMFDAGARVMAPAVASAAAQLGGLTRIVLGHGHTDHRGTAPAFDVPVYCHEDEVIDAEGSGGWRYWPSNLAGLAPWDRVAHKFLHAKVWDGGPVKIAGTLKEGDDVAGFEVVHLPGHAPGLIGLVRKSDGVALTTDCFYTLNQWGKDCDPQTPMATYNLDTEQARASIRKLAGLGISAAHPGHAEPVTSDIERKLLAAADG